MHPSLPITLTLLTLAAACSKEATSAAAPPDRAAPEAPIADAPAPDLRTPAASDSVAEGEGPRLFAAAPTLEFGSVYEGAQITHTFELEVGGTEDLVVNKIKPGCGCTAAEPIVVRADGTREPYVIETPLAPGTRLQLDVVFDTQGRRGPQAKSINVYCNDPSGVQRLALIGEVEPFLNAVPNGIRLNRLTPDETRTGEVTLTTRDGNPVRLTVDPDRLPSGLSVEMRPKTPDADGRSSAWTAVVTFGGENLREGPFQFRVPVVSDVENPHVAPDSGGDRSWLSYSIWVQAEVLALYQVSPKQMFFGPVAADTAASRSVQIYDHSETEIAESPAFRLVDAAGATLTESDGYHVTVAPLANAPGWSVELLVDGLPAGRGVFEGRIVLETGNPDRPEVEVSFKGVVR